MGIVAFGIGRGTVAVGLLAICLRLFPGAVGAAPARANSIWRLPSIGRRLGRRRLSIARLAAGGIIRLTLGTVVGFAGGFPLGLVATQFVIHFAREVAEFRTGPAKRLGLVSQHRLSRPFDFLADLFDAAPHPLFELLGVFEQTPLQTLAGGIEGLGDILALHLAGGVVEFLGEQRLRFLGIRDGLLHLVDQFGQPLALSVEFLGHLLAIGVGSQRAVLGIGVDGLFDLPPDLLFAIFQLARLVNDVAHGLVESSGGLSAELVAKFLKRLFSACARGGGAGGLALLQRLGGALHLFAGLLQLLPLFLHPLLILGGVHAGLQFIRIAEDLLLFFLQTLQLPADLLFLFLGLGRFERRLQVFELIVQIVLTAGELPQSVEDLAVFAIGRGLLLRLGHPLGFVTVFVFLEVELIELLALLGRTSLVRLLTGLLLLLLLPGDFMLAGPQFQQGLRGGLLVDECVGQGLAGRVIPGFLQVGECRPHRLRDPRDMTARFGVGHPLGQGSRLRQCLLLRFGQLGHVVRE